MFSSKYKPKIIDDSPIIPTLSLSQTIKQKNHSTSLLNIESRMYLILFI